MQTEERAESTATATDRVILGLPVDTGVLFADKKGVYKPRIEKARMKLLQNLGFLGRFLDADEKIFFVTTGCSPFTAMEQMTIGAAWLMAVKRSLFVFTNKRLFHIPTATNGKYRGSLAQILYQDCRRLHVKGSTLVAEYLTGKKEKFCNIPWGDRAIVKKFVVPDERGRPSQRQSAAGTTCAPTAPECCRPAQARALLAAWNSRTRRRP